MTSRHTNRERRNSIIEVTHTIFVLSWMLAVATSDRAGAPRWWNVIQLLPTQGTREETAPPFPCSNIPGLFPKQLRFCRKNNEVMNSIAEGTRHAIQECQHQFRTRRWNCSTIKLPRGKKFRRKSIFGTVLDSASREAAFVHALTTAGIAYTVTKACSASKLTLCGCDPTIPVVPEEQLLNIPHNEIGNWTWDGCNDDVNFGVKIAEEFVDAHERKTTARAYMNRHNNEAGRQMLLNNMTLKCRCHGFSGSCSSESCWWSMPSLRLVGDKLKEKYHSASEMKINKHKEVVGRVVEELTPKFLKFQQPTNRDLIYYQTSPNYCKRNKKKGIFGTRGRVCNVTSGGIDGCELMCCERGFNTQPVTVNERCNCVFHWCCHVKCQNCPKQYDESRCK